MKKQKTISSSLKTLRTHNNSSQKRLLPVPMTTPLITKPTGNKFLYRSIQDLYTQICTANNSNNNQPQSIHTNSYSSNWLAEQREALGALKKKLSQNKMQSSGSATYKSKLESAQRMLKSLMNLKDSSHTFTNNTKRPTLQTLLQPSSMLNQLSQEPADQSPNELLRKRSQKIHDSIVRLKEGLNWKEGQTARQVQTKEQEYQVLSREYETCRAQLGDYRAHIQQLQSELQTLLKTQEISKSDQGNQTKTMELTLQSLKQKLEVSQTNEQRLQRQLTALQHINSSLQSQIAISMTQMNTARKTEQNALLATVESLQKVNAELFNTKSTLESKLDKMTKKVTEQTRQIETIESKLIEKQNLSNNTASIVKLLESKLAEAQQQVDELIYQKSNYSDAYNQLRSQKAQHEAEISQLQTCVSQLNQKNQLIRQELELVRHQTNSTSSLASPHYQSHFEKETEELKEKVMEMTRENKDLKFQLKECRLELKSAEHKAETYLEKYYKLKNNTSVTEDTVRAEPKSRKYVNKSNAKQRTYHEEEGSGAKDSTFQQETSRIMLGSKQERQQKQESRAVLTLNTQEKSLERSGASQSRKLRVVEQLKQLVQNHRLNIITNSLR